MLTLPRQIVDDDFLHALRIYRDRDSKAVRLQASVLRGEMKRFVDCQEADESASCTHLASRAPVWTAFITNYLRSPLWLTRAGPNTVHMSELRRYIFSSEYVPEQTRHGEHILKFASDNGKFTPAEPYLTLTLPACRRRGLCPSHQRSCQTRTTTLIDSFYRRKRFNEP